jgi:hypothetical protein
MPARLIIVGILLPFVAIGLGLSVSRSALSGVLIPATFVASGALIGRWWAFAPSLPTAIGLSLVELATPTSRYGTAIEVHAGGFDPGFLLLTSSAATILGLAGAAVRVAVSTMPRRFRVVRPDGRSGS